MEKTKYGITKATPSLPARDLLRVPHRRGNLVVGFPAFGPNTYRDNSREMSKAYSHSEELPKISFRPATTSESISAAAYDFENMTKSQTFSPLGLHIGYIIKTSEGVFVNPPKDKEGNIITDEQTLKSYLNKSIEVNGIYLGENDFGFAPYETFTMGEQDCDTFAKGSLARVLEYTREKVAKNLKVISSSKNYPDGVNVWDFDEFKAVLRPANLYSSGCSGRELFVRGDGWLDSRAYAFGVLE